MGPEELLRLSCQTCGWVLRDPEMTMGLLQAHVETEHPAQVKDDGSPDIQLEMVACCLRCSAVMPLHSKVDQGIRWRLTYICESDHRTYTIFQGKDEQPT